MKTQSKISRFRLTMRKGKTPNYSFYKNKRYSKIINSEQARQIFYRKAKQQGFL